MRCHYLHCHHAVDLFFSGVPALWNAKPIPPGSAEKKTYVHSAHSATLAKQAVKNILSLTLIAKLGSSIWLRFNGLINAGKGDSHEFE